MAAFIPNRREPEVTENALAKVREDKEREAGDGFDGTWVAHPDLVPVAMEVFDRVLGDRPNQKYRSARTSPSRPRNLTGLRSARRPDHRSGAGDNVWSVFAIHRVVAGRCGGRGARQSDGGRRDRGDRARKSGNGSRPSSSRANRSWLGIEPWRSHDAEAAALFEQVALSDEFVSS